MGTNLECHKKIAATLFDFPYDKARIAVLQWRLKMALNIDDVREVVYDTMRLIASERKYRPPSDHQREVICSALSHLNVSMEPIRSVNNHTLG